MSIGFVGFVELLGRVLRAVRAGATGLLMLGLVATTTALAESPSSIVTRLDGTTYATVRDALLDAIAEEGLAAPVISDFGDMLQRTAKDLGHSPALYEEAEIFIFCSIVVAAHLATESRDHIAHCPMSIALYTVPETPGSVFMTYRLSHLQTPGAQSAAETLSRITTRTQKLTFP